MIAGQRQITGHVCAKKGMWYMVINMPAPSGVGPNKPKWHKTGLREKGNKTKAKSMLQEYLVRLNFKVSLKYGVAETTLFADYMEAWLEMMEPNLAPTTMTSYRRNIKKSIAPYFRELGVTVDDVERNPQLIQDYYTYLRKERGNGASTVRRHHANIRKALQNGVKTDLILSNAADKVEKPKPEPYKAKFYDADQMNEVFALLKGHRLYLPVLVTSFYGLRRSEFLGLKWDAIDFSSNQIAIRHTVSSVEDENFKRHIVTRDRTKNTSSYRTMPLIPQVRDALLEKMKNDREYRKVCGNCYCHENKDYIFVDELGKLMNPDYPSRTFPVFLIKHGMPRIRFHDLRHSCASLLLNQKVSMKKIQEWLGHSHYSTTANIYAHLDAESKNEAAEIMGNMLKKDE